jgi:hypothetical protein
LLEDRKACVAEIAESPAATAYHQNPAAHGAHHVLQINQYKAKDYAHLAATWPMMRQHVYVIADTLTMALVKQFPNKFS